MTRNKRLYYLQLTVSIGLVAYFLFSFDIQHILRITAWGVVYIGVVALLANVDRVLMAYKWNILLKAKGISLPLAEAIRSYYIGTFWGMFLPSSLGGDVVRGYRVCRVTKRTDDIISSIILERIIGLISTLIIGILGVSLFVIIVSPSSWQLACAVMLTLLVCGTLVGLSFNTTLAQWIARHIHVRQHRWTEKIGMVLTSYQSYQHSRGALLRFCLWSLLEQCIPIICVFCVAKALELQVPLWSFIIFVPVIVALSKIPVSIDGFGVREGLFVYFFALVGVPGSEAFVLGLLSHVVGIAAVMPMFFYFSFHRSSTSALVQNSLSG
jgi:uncharacterized protein (TIRG00374 family)